MLSRYIRGDVHNAGPITAPTGVAARRQAVAFYEIRPPVAQDAVRRTESIDLLPKATRKGVRGLNEEERERVPVRVHSNFYRQLAGLIRYRTGLDVEVKPRDPSLVYLFQAPSNINTLFLEVVAPGLSPYEEDQVVSVLRDFFYQRLFYRVRQGTINLRHHERDTEFIPAPDRLRLAYRGRYLAPIKNVFFTVN